jgi:hypothetical protein
LNAPSTQDYDETVYDANGNVIRMKLREYKPDASFVSWSGAWGRRISPTASAALLRRWDRCLSR